MRQKSLEIRILAVRALFLIGGEMGFSASGENNRKKFTGYERDGETGLDYAQARYYSSAQARFTSPDPFAGSAILVNPQTFNRYAYVGNNPVNLTDPSGLSAARNVSWGDTVGDEEQAYLGRLKNTNDALDATAALQNGQEQIARDIVGNNSSLQAIDGSGNDVTSDFVNGEPQNPTPAQTPNPNCGVNPVTGQPGFTRNPMGQTGNLRAPIGGQGQFGARRSRQRSGRHAGIDIAGALNISPVVSFLAGTVQFAGRTAGDGGTLVQIDHGNGLTSGYVHLQHGSIPAGIAANQPVGQGQGIGTLGNSGNAGGTPPHLHFWIKLNGVLQNPETFLNQPCPP